MEGAKSDILTSDGRSIWLMLHFSTTLPMLQLLTPISANWLIFMDSLAGESLWSG